MSINFNHVTNDITASSGSVSINGSVPSGGGASAITISNKTAAYTIVAGDLGQIINCTSGTFTVSLTAAATLGSGFNCWVWNNGTGTITIDPNGAETIDGVATLILRQGEGTQIVCNGTNWDTGSGKKLRSYSENFSSTETRPSTSGTNAVAIGRNASATGNNSFAVGYGASASGTGSVAFNYGSASGAGSFAVGYYLGSGLASASGNASIAMGQFNTGSTASAAYSTAIGLNSGGNGAQAVSSGATALGGSYASGTDSFAAAIASNSSSYGATGANSVAIGYQAKATSSYSISIGWGNSAGNRSVAIGGQGSTASDNSVCVGTWLSNISGAYSAAIGGGKASDRGIQNRWAYGLVSAPDVGAAQGGLHVLYAQTTDATAKVLISNSSPASVNNQVILPDNSAYAFTGTVVARRQASGGTQSAAWKVEGLIRREGSAGTTTLVASTVTAISNVPGWTLALSADTTNGGLAVTATGAAATNIRWVATIDSSEVIYA